MLISGSGTNLRHRSRFALQIADAINLGPTKTGNEHQKALHNRAAHRLCGSSAYPRVQQGEDVL